MKTTFKRISPTSFAIIGAKHKAVCAYDADSHGLYAVFSIINPSQEVGRQTSQACDILNAVEIITEIMEMKHNN
jgi:hypothetical protein